MEIVNYPPPVDKLLTYGDCRELPAYPDYLELGLGPEHIPDLIRMATDPELRWADSDTLEVWAPIHAFRALGQLHAEAAIEPLLSLFAEADDDEWVMEELPEVYGMIGPAAIPALAAYIADPSQNEWALVTAAGALEKIGKMHPEARDECVNALTEQLKLFDENEPTFNAFLIEALVELKAVEAAPLIKRAFAADCVDEMVMGGWKEVQIELGLKPPREEAPQSRFNFQTNGDTQSTSDEEVGVSSSYTSSSKASQKYKVDQKKAKNKMAKQSRKKNRKRQ